MLDVLDRKLRQIQAALGLVDTTDFSSIRVTSGTTARGVPYQTIDFSGGATEPELANQASLLIANIACIKDHLKVWCRMNQKPFEGETLIDSDPDVATIHDLWNIDKHAALNKPPRSGHRPKLVGLGRALTNTSGTDPRSDAALTVDMSTGEMKVKSTDGGSLSLVLVGQVVDENGQHLGWFLEICRRAVERWEEVLRRAGVPIPPT